MKACWPRPRSLTQTNYRDYGGNMSMLLKLDAYVKRAPDRSARYEPAARLTKKQKDKLAKECWDSCLRAYISRMTNSGLLSDFETNEDLVSEAYISMWNILEKFDISKCGLIAKFDVPGAKKPKTLGFYFKNYYYGRVNFIAAESRVYKKNRGVGPADNVGEITYDPQDNSSITQYNYEHKITGVLLHELEKKGADFKRFFYQTFQLQCTQREMRQEYGDNFNNLKYNLNKFIEEVKKINEKEDRE